MLGFQIELVSLCFGNGVFSFQDSDLYRLEENAAKERTFWENQANSFKHVFDMRSEQNRELQHAYNSLLLRYNDLLEYCQMVCFD